MASGGLAALWLCAAVAPPLPPSKWMSDLKLELILDDRSRVSTGIFAYNADTKKQYYSSNTNESGLVPLSWVGTDKENALQEQWALSDGAFMGLNGREYLISNLGFDKTQQFAWVPYSTYTGTTTINGVQVNEFHFTDPSGAADYTYYAQPDGTPVREIMNITTSALQEYLHFDFTNVRALNASVFDTFDKTAAYQPPVCPVGSVTPVTLDMYVFHPRANVNISGQNTADLAGDAAFVCYDQMSNNTKNDHYDVVSWYQVQVLPVWGRYQPCNGYPSVCYGGKAFYVGRETAFGLTRNGGQCSESDLAEVGTWWSLSADGECGESETPGDGQCTWKVVKRVKTIDAVQCLFGEQRMLDMCTKEKRMPFPQTQKIFQAAFTETDPSKGGCPAIQP